MRPESIVLFSGPVGSRRMMSWAILMAVLAAYRFAAAKQSAQTRPVARRRVKRLHERFPTISVEAETVPIR
jgi:hypothetical protein